MSVEIYPETNMPNEDIVTNIFAPTRPKLEAARYVAKAHTTPRATWEALASRGVIPMSWLTHERRFVGSRCRVCSGTGKKTSRDYRDEEYVGACDNCDEIGVVLLETPPTRAACVAFASDPEGIETAEALAREACARLSPWEQPDNRFAPWKSPHQDRPVWSLYRERSPSQTHYDWRAETLTKGPRHLLYFLDERFKKERPSSSPTNRQHASRAVLQNCVETDLLGSRHWQEAIQRRLTIPPKSTLGEKLSGRPLQELPDPFAPVLSLWSIGYALQKKEAGCLWLFAPPAP